MNEKLLELESSCEYLFHGSANPDIEILEPRQSTHIPDLTKPKDFILDGDPAVSATPNLEMAIFRSIINGRNIDIPHTSGFGYKNEEIYFRVSHEEVLKKAEGKEGYIYVFNKNDFTPYTRMGEEDGKGKGIDFEWRAYKPVKPVQVIPVGYEDLPKNIKILNKE